MAWVTTSELMKTSGDHYLGKESERHAGKGDIFGVGTMVACFMNRPGQARQAQAQGEAPLPSLLLSAHRASAHPLHSGVCVSGMATLD